MLSYIRQPMVLYTLEDNEKHSNMKFSCRHHDCDVLGEQIPPAQHICGDRLESDTGGSSCLKDNFLFSQSFSLPTIHAETPELL